MLQPSWTAEADATLLGIGDLAAAERSLLAGLEDLGEESPRDRIIYQARLAQVQLRAGRGDEAAVTAREAATAAEGTAGPPTQRRTLDGRPPGVTPREPVRAISVAEADARDGSPVPGIHVSVLVSGV